MKKPELFQGEKRLNKSKYYFEGWYFKNTNDSKGISFIPGINITKEEKKAFIQVITNDASYFVDFPIKSFSFGYDPFYIKIGNNTFSKEGIYIDIKDDKQNLHIAGELRYKESKNIKKTILNPNIMGPFSYAFFMECNHAILSMQNKIEGIIKINDDVIKFNNSNGYIEKDWGETFPKTYIWCQGNNFQKKNSSFMCSIADINFKVFHFRGLICVLLIDNEEYKFTTYNNTKILEYKVDEKIINIVLKKGNYILTINSIYNEGNKLLAPVKGKMDKYIYESISSSITVTLKENDNVIFSDTSNMCGLELVK